jgi:tRNA(His) guanylyltransferase
MMAPLLAAQPEETLLKGTYIVVRLDGRKFTSFCLQHGMLRPIDDRLVSLMASCGYFIMEKYPDIALSFGQSDEFSFVFKKSTQLFDRRRDHILSSIVSTFTASFVLQWRQFFAGVRLAGPPSFDARAVLYSHFGLVRDYVSWRQADAHVNCLYNYTLCVLMRTGIDGPAATEALRGTVACDKHEIMMQHGVDFAMVPAAHRRGVIWIRTEGRVIRSTDDLIRDEFWQRYKRCLK